MGTFHEARPFYVLALRVQALLSLLKTMENEDERLAAGILFTGVQYRQVANIAILRTNEVIFSGQDDCKARFPLNCYDTCKASRTHSSTAIAYRLSPGSLSGQLKGPDASSATIQPPRTVVSEDKVVELMSLLIRLVF